MKKTPFMTPELLAMHREQMQSKATSDLIAIHAKLLAAIEEHSQHVQDFKDQAEEIRSHADRIQNLPPGEKGESIQGEPGVSPDVEQIVNTVLSKIPTPKDGVSPDPELIASRVVTRIKVRDGKDAIIDENALAEKVVEHIKVNKKLTKEHIGGLDEEISSYRNQMAMKQAGQHGGGDTVTAGSNVTITTDSNGKKVISASTGAAAPLTPTGTVNGSNTVFTVLSEPSSVIADGITYFAGAGYTYLALTITMDTAPSQYIRYYA